MADQWTIWNGHWPTLPLHTACAEGRSCLIELLLDKGADVNVAAYALGQPEAANSPMYYIMIHDDIDLMKLLLPKYTIRYNVTPLHYACMKGAEKCAKYILDNKLYAPDHVADNFSMPLEIAVRTSVPITKLLIQHGAPLHHHRSDHMAVIHHAISPFSAGEPTRLVHHAVPEVVKILLENGADVNVTHQDLTVVEMFFQHIQVLYQRLAEDEDAFDVVDQFWSGLSTAAQMIVGAGLIVKALNLTQSYLRCLQSICIFYRSGLHYFPHSSCTTEGSVAVSLKRSYELFQIFYDGKISNGNETLAGETLYWSNKFLKCMVEYGRTECGMEISNVIREILRLIYMNIPGQIIPTEYFTTTLETFKEVPLDKKTAVLKILDILIYFVPLGGLHKLQDLLSDDMVEYRMSLKCLAKLSVISALEFPREDKINLLEVPNKLKSTLFLLN